MAPVSASHGDASTSNGDTATSNGDASTSKGNGTGTIFALIIGINDYKFSEDLPCLRGAVSDAKEFQRYLLDSYDDKGLQVPPENIVLLENEHATRDAILSAFKTHFLDNENIPDHGEAQMVFYFAGHGTRAEATGNLMSRDMKVEAICPVDERTTNAAGEYVHTIPDYILGWLFAELAEKKGPNITVILDSCNSGGMARIVGAVARTASLDAPRIPPELDDHLWKGKTKTVQSYRLWHSPTTSHVLLAACRATEKALEVDYNGTKRGRFTVELIACLRWAPYWSTTYEDLIGMIPLWDNQTPHCGGTRSKRCLFDGNYPKTGRQALLLKPHRADPEGNPNDSEGSPKDPEGTLNSTQSFRVDIGAVEGVVPGTVFHAYDPRNNLLCTFVAQSVQTGHAILRGENLDATINIPPGSRARVYDWKNHPRILRVHTPEDFLYTADLFPATADRLPKFVQAERKDAHVVVRSDGDEFVLEPLTDTMRKCSTKRRFTTKPEHLPDVLDGIAHFNYFLDRANDADRLHGFALEMHQLCGKYPIREVDRSVGQDGNMVVDKAVRFVSNEDAKYGFTIRNTSPEELFPYLFYFDAEDYTIAQWYLPENRHTRPLAASKGSMTLGMGGEMAFEFTLPKGQRESSGFLKLFVAREFIDFGWIQQSSPFEDKFEGTGRLEAKREALPHISMWDALTVTLTMTSD